MAPKDCKTNRSIDRAFVQRRRALLAIAKKAGSEENEDIVQDAFLRIVERSHRQDIAKLDNLLAHVVRCLTIDRLRRRTFRSAFMSVGTGEDVVDPAVDPERSLIGAQRLERVLAAVASMPPKRREVFLLHRIEDLSYAQIARRMKLSVKTVQQHFYLAMRQLSDTDE